MPRHELDSLGRGLHLQWLDRRDRQAGSPDEIGPWSSDGRTSAQFLDEALEADSPDSYGDPVESAKAFLSRTEDTQLPSQEDLEQSHLAELEAERSLSPLGAVKRYGPPLAETALAAGVMIPNPAQPAFAGALAARGLGRFAQDPNTETGLMAGLEMLPAAAMAKRAYRGFQGVQGTLRAQDRIRQGVRVSSERPYRTASSEAPPNPTDALADLRGASTATQGGPHSLGGLAAVMARTGRNSADDIQGMVSKFSQDTFPEGLRKVRTTSGAGAPRGAAAPRPERLEQLTDRAVQQGGGAAAPAPESLSAIDAASRAGRARPQVQEFGKRVRRNPGEPEAELGRGLPKGKFDPSLRSLAPDEAAAEAEFWDLIMRQGGV